MSLDSDQRLKLELILSGSAEKPELLSDWETGFVASFQVRYDDYKDEVLISDKQWAILDRIYELVMADADAEAKTQ